VRPKIKSLLTLGAPVFVAGIASADTAPWRLKTEDGKVTAYGTDVGYEPTRGRDGGVRQELAAGVRRF